MLRIIPIPITAGITGFESPAAEYLELPLSLDDILIEKKHASFLGIASGSSMEQAGIFDGDLLIADRSMKVQNMDVVIAIFNGELTAKYWLAKEQKLISANQVFKDIEISDTDDFKIEAVVTRSIRLFRPSRLLLECLH